MTRSFNEWWNAIPSDLKEKTPEGGEGNKQSLNQLNHTLLHLDLAGRHEAKSGRQRPFRAVRQTRSKTIPRRTQELAAKRSGRRC